MDIEQIYKYYQKNYLVDTDTRNIRKGSVFFALKGDKFDGNTFAQKAIELGAEIAIIDNPTYQSKKTILVKDTLKTLQSLATYHRKQLDVTIISITGSNGKTTTKELIYAVLSTKYNVTATKGNLNNHIGVPLTLLSMTPSTDLGIVEMGANHLEEIAELCEICQPNFGYITNFGKAHLEGFGSYEGIIKGKSELYDYLKQSKGICFANAEDTKQLEKSAENHRVLFLDDILLTNTQPYISCIFQDTIINSHLIGTYNFLNIKAAITIGNYFNVSNTFIKQAIENYIPSNNRSQEIQKGTIKIILDAYNANPSSMKAALQNFAQLKEQQKIIFLGDMFELGSYSEEEHQNIYDFATSLDFSKIYLIGEYFSKVVTDKNTVCYLNFNDLKKELSTIKLSNSTVLIKGSRGMALERILENI